MEIVDPCEKTIVQNNRLIPATYPQESCSRRRAPYVLAPGDVCGGVSAGPQLRVSIPGGGCCPAHVESQRPPDVSEEGSQLELEAPG